MITASEVVESLGVRDAKIGVLKDNCGFRKNYLLSGRLPWGCDKAVLKIVHKSFLDEIKVYAEERFLEKHKPKVYAVDTEKCFVVMEYLDCCVLWDKKGYKEAIKAVADMHSIYWGAQEVPKWVPWIGPATKEQVISFYDAIKNNNIKELNPYVDVLIKGVEDHHSMFDSVLNSTHTVIHGDYMYSNIGFSKGNMVFFDWSAIRIAPPSYEICYPVEQLDEMYGSSRIGINKDEVMEFYISEMRKNGINLEVSKFKRDCKISYLRRCFFSYIPSYVKGEKISLLKRKLPIVCDIIKELGGD